MSTVLEDVYRTPQGVYDALRGEDQIGIDIETSGLNPFGDKVAVVQMIGRSGKIGILHCRGVVPPMLTDLFAERPDRLWIGHNITAFDGPFLWNNGVPVFAAKWYDTMTGELATLQTGRRDRSVSLKATVERRTGKKLRKQADHGTWMNPSLSEEQLDYLVGDVTTLFEVMDAQEKRAKESGVWRAVETEMAVLPAVMRMTCNGLPLNTRTFWEYIGKQSSIRKEADAYLREVFGNPDINLNSWQQLIKAFEALGMQIPSTASEVLLRELRLLDEGSEAYKVIESLLEYRHAKQRAQMYTPEWYTKYVTNGWLHPRFWQLGTDTGRFSSSEPNFQQWPKKMRYVIEHPDSPDWKIVWADLSQVEVRMFAALSRDPQFIALCSKEHVHSEIASELFNKPISDLNTDEKKIAKAVVFCELFLGSPKTAYTYARNAGSEITLTEMTALFDRFDSRFRVAARWKQKAREVARGSGGKVMLTLPTGLKRLIVGDQVTPSRLVNTRVQGGAAAIMKYSLIEAERRGLTKYLGATVHDELVACVPATEAEEFKLELVAAMEAGGRQAMPQGVDMAVTVKATVDDRWGD